MVPACKGMASGTGMAARGAGEIARTLRSSYWSGGLEARGGSGPPQQAVE